MANKNAGLALTLLLTVVLGFGSVCGAAAKSKQGGLLFKPCVLTVDKGKDMVRITLAPAEAGMTTQGNKIILTGAIKDFSIPFNKIKSRLHRKSVAGKVLVNRVEIYPADNKKHTAVVVRFTIKGVGGGHGKAGISLLTAFCLDRQILKRPAKAAMKVPSSGKLAPSGGSLKQASLYIKADLGKAGAESKTYTSLAGMGSKDNLFLGFAVWDPTKPKSIKNAYFEFKGSQRASAPWSLKALNK